MSLLKAIRGNGDSIAHETRKMYIIECTGSCDYRECDTIYSYRIGRYFIVRPPTHPSNRMWVGAVNTLHTKVIGGHYKHADFALMERCSVEHWDSAEGGLNFPSIPPSFSPCPALSVQIPQTSKFT